jgi:glycolate oxidase iron-sulfur subunit
MATPEELHQAVLKIGRANPEGRQSASKYLKRLDYSVLQQCIHCGMCLPTCPTYDETKLERNGPRGRIALMRRIADGQLEVTQAFGQETLFLPGLLNMRNGVPGRGALRRDVRARAR